MDCTFGILPKKLSLYLRAFKFSPQLFYFSNLKFLIEPCSHLFLCGDFLFLCWCFLFFTEAFFFFFFTMAASNLCQINSSIFVISVLSSIYFFYHLVWYLPHFGCDKWFLLKSDHFYIFFMSLWILFVSLVLAGCLWLYSVMRRECCYLLTVRWRLKLRFPICFHLPLVIPG